MSMVSAIPRPPCRLQDDSPNSIIGNGFPDYLCLDPDGRTTAWINTNMQFVELGQIKFAAGADRADVRFADINGDVSIEHSYSY